MLGFWKSVLASNSSFHSGSKTVFRKLREVTVIIFYSVWIVESSFMQLLDLFVNEDWSQYVNEYQNPSSKYRSINPAMVYSLLFK